MKKLISVCGSDETDENLSDYALRIAEDVGRLIAKKGGVIICGGRGGIMNAACKGAKKENGTTVGLLPFNKKEANHYVDIPIETGIGNIRNFLVANAGEVVIAISGRWGTLNEITFSIIFKKPLILIKGTGGIVDKIINGELIKEIKTVYYIVESAEKAVEKAFESIKQ